MGKVKVARREGVWERIGQVDMGRVPVAGTSAATGGCQRTDLWIFNFHLNVHGAGQQLSQPVFAEDGAGIRSQSLAERRVLPNSREQPRELSALLFSELHFGHRDSFMDYQGRRIGVQRTTKSAWPVSSIGMSPQQYVYQNPDTGATTLRRHFELLGRLQNAWLGGEGSPGPGRTDSAIEAEEVWPPTPSPLCQRGHSMGTAVL
jgi:hypothetical protein